MLKVQASGTEDDLKDPSHTARQHHPRGLLPRWLEGLPMLVVLGALGGLGYWGHKTEWNFGYEMHRKGKRVLVEEGIVSTTVTLDNKSIVFENEAAVERVGIDVAPAWTAAMQESISSGGELEFDANQMARISAKASGSASWVGVSAGDQVEQGSLLALIDAATVGRAKVELQQAMLLLRFKKDLAVKLRAMGNAIQARQLQEALDSLREAEGRLAGAEQALANLGFTIRASALETTPWEEVVQRIRLLGIAESESKWSGDDAAANFLPLRAPLSGVVLQAHVVVGEVVELGKPLFVIVNPSRMWLMVHVAMVDALKVKLGQRVVFTPDSGTVEFIGKVSQVGSTADEVTRTIPVRVDLPNESGSLRARMLGRCKIILRDAPDAITVPNDAIQVYDTQTIVFVRHADYLKENGSKAFEARVVKVGAKDEKQTEITQGIEKGEVVATKGSAFLLNQLKAASRKPMKQQSS